MVAGDVGERVRSRGVALKMGVALTLCGLSLTTCAGTKHAAPSTTDPPPVALETANPEPTTPLAPVPARPRFDAPVEVPAALAAHDLVQRRTWGRPLPPSELVHFAPIEETGTDTLAAFHRALRSLEPVEGRADDAEPRKVRVAIYGSSSVAADRYSAYLRGYLQHRFGDGGVGFVAAVPLWRWHRHDAIQLDASKRWTIEHAQREAGKLDGHYGLLGASAHTSTKRAYTKLSARSGSLTDAEECSDLELLFLRQPGGGRFDVEVLGKRVATVDTEAAAFEPGYFRPSVEGPALPLALRTRGDGEVRLFGAILENTRSGVVVDELGIGGTRAANLLAWNLDLWREHLVRRRPDLYVLAYGANEAVDEDEPIAVYEENLDRVLTHFAAALPEASCVLVGPVEFPVQERDAWRPRERILSIIEVQRRLAAVHGCGFWDTHAFMGGAGSMHAWATAEPALAKRDHLHLTTLGYLHLGRVLTDALMADYDREALTRDR